MFKSAHSFHGFATEIFKDEKLGRVKISFNEEDEVKMALVASGPNYGHEEIAAEKLWQAYVALKTKEWQDSFGIHTITRANGSVLSTPLHAETKAYRERLFYTVEAGHHANVEIRVENLTTMIKIAAEREMQSRVLRRAEIRIEQQKPGEVSFDYIPGKYGKFLSSEFNGKQQRIAAVQTKSWRDKITVPMLFNWNGEDFVFMYERAKDIGVSRSLAGHVRDINEFEGEVKHVYRHSDYVSGKPVDIKEDPDFVGMSREGFKEVVDAFLHARLDNFLDFSNAWLSKNGFGDCQVMPVTHSKSWPEMDGFHKVLASLGADRRPVLRAIHQAKIFAPNPVLDARRLEMAS